MGENESRQTLWECAKDRTRELHDHCRGHVMAAGSGRGTRKRAGVFAEKQVLELVAGQPLPAVYCSLGGAVAVEKHSHE